MVVMRSITYLFFILCLGCYTPSKYRKELKKLNYEGKIDYNKRVNIQGYFHSIDSNSLGCSYSLLLFDDGTFLEHLPVNKGLNEIDSFLCSLKTNTNWRMLNKYNYYRSWGFYKIESDTIKGLVIQAFGSMNLYLYEVEYKIINDTTLQRLKNYRHKNTVSKNDYEISKRIFDKEQCKTLFLRKTNCIPDFEPWLKQKRWFWADKKEYKAYKKELRNKKK